MGHDEYAVRLGALGRAVASNQLATKADKYAALACVFRASPAVDERLIGRLLTPCGGVTDCRVASPQTISAGVDALRSLREPESMSALNADALRLFGSVETPSRPPLVFPCGSGYLAEDADHMDEEIAWLYETAGFVPAPSDERPTHMGEELRFMAHLLTQASAGSDVSRVLAHDFLVTHLCRWGAVFAAATVTRAEHPVIRLGAIVLENLLFCHAGLLRPDAAHQPWALLASELVRRHARQLDS